MDALVQRPGEGGTEGLLAAYDCYAERLYAYSRLLLADDGAATAALRDAFLVAAERAGTLRDPARVLPWLYALARNECLRRRRSRRVADAEREMVELAVGHGLSAREVAAVLGIGHVEVDAALAAAQPPEGADDPAAVAPPAGLRDRLDAAAADPAAAADRAALSDRAGPFKSDGFPRPLDRRQLSGRVLAASIVVVVVGTLVLLFTVPNGRPGASGGPAGAAPGAPAAAAATTRTSADGSAWPAPEATPATGLRAPSRAVAPPAATARLSAPPRPPGAGGPFGATPDSGGRGGLTVVGWVDNRTGSECSGEWTARVIVQVTGGTPDQVVATWSDGADTRTVRLRHRGGEWVGDLYGLPVGKQLWWRAVATAAGATASTAQQPLRYTCQN